MYVRRFCGTGAGSELSHCRPVFNPIVPHIDCEGEWQSACTSADRLVLAVVVADLFVGSAPLNALAIRL
jgi:hypothetical protein